MVFIVVLAIFGSFVARAWQYGIWSDEKVTPLQKRLEACYFVAFCFELKTAILIIQNWKLGDKHWYAPLFLACLHDKLQQPHFRSCRHRVLLPRSFGSFRYQTDCKGVVGNKPTVVSVIVFSCVLLSIVVLTFCSKDFAFCFW